MEKGNVFEIFRELVGDKADKLRGSFYPTCANAKITNALIEDYSNLKDDAFAETDSIGMDLVCWQRNATFTVALVLFPEKFTDEEVEDDFDGFQYAPSAVVKASVRINDK